ncbi:TrbC/VirB2 family protein [Pseudomonas reactans]|uniref:TrbC/VirB2 family protein n=1 Tax=Pseudomonas reactans TaxID=117680 RepID=UPI0015BE07AA|nr:TrbC/VirB2 family protein [Pseudomonas reactans]NWD80912.1 TrbC/VirB2 family protein [Pseudomonas reactans]
MQIETGKSNFRKSETVNKQSWVATFQQSNTVTTLRNIFTPKHGMNHAALMRKDWTAKAEKIAVLGSLALLPEFANAAMDFSSVKNLLKDIVSFLIFDIGYYLGILAIVVQGFRAKSGRVEWSTFGWTVAGVFLVFFAPNIVAEIKSGAATSLQ